MQVYVIEDCKECDELVVWTKDKKIDVEIVDIKKIDDNFFKQTDDGYTQVSTRAFPALSLGSSTIIGKEGCQLYLEKGFYHEVKLCPYTQSNCIEKKCEKFIILKKGDLDEGGCCDYFNSFLLTELIILMTKNKRG